MRSRNFFIRPLLMVFLLLSSTLYSMDGKMAMEIKIIRNGNKIAVYLHNNEKQTVNVLIDPDIQSPELVIKDQSGRILTPFDKRSIKVYDNSPYCYMVKTIDPDSVALLGSIDENCISTDNSLQFGTYSYELLKPGNYTVFARFVSSVGTCAKKEKKRQEPIKNVWLGSVESEPFQINIH